MLPNPTNLQMPHINPFCIGIPNIILLILALIFSKNILFSDIILKIIGILLILSVFVFEFLSHKKHKQAHDKAEKINKLVTTGIYKKIRHPIYLGWVLLNIGAFLFIGTQLSLCISVLFILFWYLEARSEERFLETRFKSYKEYKKKTGMFLPKNL